MYHFRIPADSEYLHLLGRAVYNFATHEWMVAWTLEKLKPGFINECNETGMTAGTIAKRFGEILKERANTLSPDHYQKLSQVQQKFASLAKVRNQLLHAHPGTALGGAQQLFYSRGSHGQMEWPMQQVEQAAIDFENNPSPEISGGMTSAGSVKGSSLCQISRKNLCQIIRKVTGNNVIWEIILRDFWALFCVACQCALQRFHLFV